MKKIIISLLLGLLSITAPSIEAQSIEKTLTSATNVPASDTDNAAVVKHISLKQISNQNVLYLRGTQGGATVALAGHADEVITHAVLHLRYTYSPALLPLESHLKVSLNDEIVGVFPLSKEDAGRNTTQDIEIDPRLFANPNWFKFELIGHYTHECEDPLHTSLWMEISGSSQLDLTVQPLTLKNDLALLPLPFFNSQDFNGKLSIPFVFPPAPDKSTLNAAGVISSWFGKLAAWRGARFSASLDRLPAGQAIVFATNSARPNFLSQYPKIEGPALEIITNPIDGHSKLLLILGRDGNDQKIAAQTLVLGNAALSGSKVLINKIKAEIPRQAYDAPNWVRLDRPMKFGEMVSSTQDLQVSGHSPQPIRIPLRVPADLFTWRSSGIPVDLKYRYTPPIRASESRLSMSVNDELVKTFNLLTSGEIEKTNIPISRLDQSLLGGIKEILLPTFKLGSNNELQFSFSYAYQKEEQCKDSIVENVRSVIDADSTVDFTSFPHYAEMPNLNFFTTSGFPFTQFADLSQTVVILQDHPTTYEIETMLTLLGRMGESTGYPATQFNIANPNDISLFKNADLLVIGASLYQGQLAKWTNELPVDVHNTMLRISQPKRSTNFLYNWLNFEVRADTNVLAQQHLSGNGSLTAMLGFESPVSNKRSVVAVIATQPEQLTQALDALEDRALSNNIQGSAVFIHPNKVEGFLVGPTYFVGELPLWTSIWYQFADHPFLLAILAIISVLIFAFALWRTLKLLSTKRLKGEH